MDSTGLGNTLSKKERLSGKTDIAKLMSHGKWGYCSCLRYCYLTGTGCDCNRIIVSVPKKYFKRAVKRNLLKRRMRESYRTQKGLLQVSEGVDILFVYDSKDILNFQDIKGLVAQILTQVK